MAVGDGDIIRAVLNITMINGDVAKNVFTWLVQKVSLGDWTDAAAAGYAADAIELIFAEILSVVTTGQSFDTLDLYKWTGLVWDYLTTAVPSITPTGAGDASPAGVAMLMTAYTDLNKVFGRKFVYGPTEGSITATVLHATALTYLANAAAEYIASYSGGTMGPLDFLVPGVYSTKTADFEPFNGIAVVKNILSYQRRRKSGVGV